MHTRPSHQLNHDWSISLDSVTNEKSRVIATFDLSEARSVSKVRLIAHGRYRKFSLFHTRTVKLKAEDFKNKICPFEKRY